MSNLKVLTTAAALGLAALMPMPSFAQHARVGGGGGGHFAGGGGGMHMGGGARMGGGSFQGGGARFGAVSGATNPRTAAIGRTGVGGGGAAVVAGGGGWRGGGGWHGGHFHRGGGFWPGVAAGAVIGGALAYPYGAYAYDDYPGYGYYDEPGYYAEDSTVAVVPDGGDSAAYCAQRFRSYDPASGTYLGYDGQRHPCP